MPTPNNPPQVTPTPTPAPQRGIKATFSQLVDNFVTWLIVAVGQFNALSQWVSAIASDLFVAATAAYNSAQAAAASAALAQSASHASVAAADLVATSTTSNTVGTGIKNFTIQTGKQFKPGMPVRGAFTAAPGNYVDGYVRTYDPATGAFSMQSQQFLGTGTSTAWTIAITGPSPLAVFLGGGGASRVGLNGNYRLDGISAKLQIVNCDSGANITMASYYETIPGYNIFEIVNEFSGSVLNTDLALFTNDSNGYPGVAKGFLPPGRATAAHMPGIAGSVEDWIFPEASPAGKPIRVKGTPSSRISDVNGTFLRFVQLDADRYLFILHGASVHAIIFNKTDNYWGPLTLIRATMGASGTGAVDNVLAALIGTDTVLVASCPLNSTALQMVVVTTGGGTSNTGISPNTPQVTATGASVTRLLGLDIVGTSYVLSYVNASVNLRMQARTITGTTISSPGTEVAAPVATSSTPTVVVASATVIGVITSSINTLSITAYSVTGSAIALGSAISTAVTSFTGIGVKKVISPTGRWFVTFINSSAKMLLLTFTGTTPVNNGIVGISSALATITAVQSQTWDFGIATAVTGTDASGGFITEFGGFIDTGSAVAPTLLSSIVQRYSASAPTLAPAGTSWNGGTIYATISWTLSCSKNIETLSFTGTNAIFAFSYSQLIGPSNVSVPQPVPAIYTQKNLHNATLSKFGAINYCALGDGTKPALYSATGLDLQTMRNSPAIIVDPANGAKGVDESSLWVAYSLGTVGGFIIEEVRFV